MESVALLTKAIGIVTPLILSIVVSVAPRLILYKRTTSEQRQIVLYKRTMPDQHQIISYKRMTPDHIVQENDARSYHTRASMRGRKWIERKQGSPMYLRNEVKSEHNNWHCFSWVYMIHLHLQCPTNDQSSQCHQQFAPLNQMSPYEYFESLLSHQEAVLMMSLVVHNPGYNEPMHQYHGPIMCLS